MADNHMNESSQKDNHIQQEKKKSILLRIKDKIKERQQDQVEEEYVPGKWVQLRMLPIWSRVLLVIILLVIVAFIGLRIGYGVIGDGDPADILKKETWTHIVDIVKGKEKE